MVTARRRTALAALLILACGPTKAPGDATDTTSGSSGSSGSSEPTGAAMTGASEPTTTGMTGTSEPMTAGTAGTSGTAGTTGTTGTTGASGETSGDDTSTGPGPVCREWHPHTGCPLEFPGTMVHGEGPLANIKPITQVYFGIFGWVCKPGNTLEIMRVRAPDGPFLEFAEEHVLECAPEGWIGDHPIVKYNTGGVGTATVTATLTIDGFAGDWDSEVPVDPPRVIGHFSGDLVGPVELLRCDLLDTFIDRCA